MKHVLVFIMMLLMALPALAQHRHGRGHGPRGRIEVNWPRPRPMPRPVPRHSCQVVMLDRYNRVINRYWARSEGRFGQCTEGLRQCHWDLRLRGAWGARCAQVR